LPDGKRLENDLKGCKKYAYKDTRQSRHVENSFLEEDEIDVLPGFEVVLSKASVESFG
jgi:hypothetical protein